MEVSAWVGVGVGWGWGREEVLFTPVTNVGREYEYPPPSMSMLPHLSKT